MQRYRLQQSFDPVPSNLHTDTNQEERRQLRDYRHPRRSKDSRQPVGKSIAEQNADRDQQQSNECSQNCQKDGTRDGVPSLVATEIDPGPTVSGIVMG